MYATYVKDVTHRVLVFTRSGESLGEAGIGGLFTVLRIGSARRCGNCLRHSLQYAV